MTFLHIEMERTPRICFLDPTEAREDRVTVDRWFFNATSKNCEPYKLELNLVDIETRTQLNDFASFRSCYRFCAKIVKNMSDFEIATYQRQGSNYDQSSEAIASANVVPEVEAPTIVVSGVDIKARREHNPSGYSNNNQKSAEYDGSSSSNSWSAYKQQRSSDYIPSPKQDRGTSSSKANGDHFVSSTIGILFSLVFTTTTIKMATNL